MEIPISHIETCIFVFSLGLKNYIELVAGLPMNDRAWELRKVELYRVCFDLVVPKNFLSIRSVSEPLHLNIVGIIITSIKTLLASSISKVMNAARIVLFTRRGRMLECKTTHPDRFVTHLIII